MTAMDRQLSLERSFEGWTELLSRALETRGFASLTAYADHRPKSSLSQLSTELGADIPPVILEQKLVTEARAAGEMERCARGLLARYLRAELPDGWQDRDAERDDDTDSQRSRLSSVFLALEMALPAAYEDAVARLQRAMSTAVLPSGWLPSGPDDLTLVELFASYWISGSAGGH